MTENLGVAELQEESERVIVAAIEKHARGDVEALARGIIEGAARRRSGDPPRRCDFNTQSEALIGP
jgi:hypothetical protein